LADQFTSDALDVNTLSSHPRVVSYACNIGSILSIIRKQFENEILEFG